MAAALIIDRRGAAIEVASRGVLRVQYDDEVHRVGVHAIGQLVLLGNVALSTAVLRSCFDAGVDVVLLARRGRQQNKEPSCVMTFLPARPSRFFPLPKPRLLARPTAHRP